MGETISSWTAQVAPPLRPVARRTRALVKSTFPDLVEHIRPGVVVYGRSSAPRDWLLYISQHRDHLNLGFAHGLGSAVADPSSLIQGSGKTMRHLTLRTVADTERPALRAVLRDAARLVRQSKTDRWSSR